MPPFRSRKGCHTCKRRHKKCDERSPICERCEKSGFVCEGYEFRLIWGPKDDGTKPPPGPILIYPERSKRPRKQAIEPLPSVSHQELAGRQYSFSDWELSIINHQPEYDSPTSEDITERRLMQAFATQGHLSLTGRAATDNLLTSQILPLADECLPLRNVCMAYQASIEDEKELTATYLERALHGYYSNLYERTELFKDSTLATGILLCSVSISASYVWSPLVRGLEWILETRGLLDPTQRSVISDHLIEVIGLLDLQCFTLNCMSPPLNLWKRYVAPWKSEGVEESSAVPYSLINILSDLDNPDAEDLLRRWPGELDSSYSLLYIWEAIRFAAILYVRLKSYQDFPIEVLDDQQLRQTESLGEQKENRILIFKVLSLLQAARDAANTRAAQLLSDHIAFPLFVASIITEPQYEERGLAQEMWRSLREGIEKHRYQVCYDIVLEVWKRREQETSTSPWSIASNFAAELNIEFYLS